VIFARHDLSSQKTLNLEECTALLERGFLRTPPCVVFRTVAISVSATSPQKAPAR
jgi:hypothetical protein